MAIGILTLDLYLPGVRSLKHKRKILKSLKDRIGNRFNVSIAEMDAHEKWQRGILGVVNINNDQRYIESLLNTVVKFVENSYDCQVINHQVEFI